MNLNNPRIYKSIDSHTVISFDLFDTLIKRDCIRPTDVFAFIENDHACDIKNFKTIRIEAERKAHEAALGKGMEEASLEEIYSFFPSEVSEVDRRTLLALEERYELSLCQMNPEMIPLLEYIKQHGKKIVITTDIYLPEELIMRILTKCQVSYDELFISSVYRKTKRGKGTLYNEVINRLSVSPKDILHIGDNRRSDIYQARRKGIETIHIPTESYSVQIFDSKYYKKNREYRNLIQFISNHRYTDHDIFYSTGYDGIGPILFGFVKWLENELRKEKFDKVYFLARDGQIMKKAFDMLDTGIESRYFYASRRALIVPSLHKSSSIEDLKNRIFWPRYGNIADFISKLGLNPPDYEDVYREHGFDLMADQEMEKLFSEPDFRNLYEKALKNDVISNSKEEYNLIRRYMEQEGLSGKCAIVDIGWFGHMQMAIEDILGADAEIHGYYIGLSPDSEKHLNRTIDAKGYLFDANHFKEGYYQERVFTPIFESSFTADHGTTLKYKEKDGTVQPVFDKWEYSDSDEYGNIKRLQDAALQFVDDASKEPEFNIDWSPEVVFANVARLGRYPNKKEAQIWGDMKQMDVTVKYIAKPQKKRYYLGHPKRFKSDLVNSLWREGFLTRLFGGAIPYYDIYYFLRRLRGIKYT